MDLIFLLIFVLVVVLPAYYINKWMMKITKPRESFGRFLIYMFLSVVIALAYSAVFIIVITSIYPLSKK